MVFSISTRDFHGKFIQPSDVLIADRSEDKIQPQPDPIMENIQKDTSVQDLGEEENNTRKITGEGFVVRGGKLKPQNNKLRKFVSLNLK